MVTPCLADHNIPRPPRTRGGAALSAGPLDARGGVALAVAPLDATVVGAALEKAIPLPRAPHGPDIIGSGHAARADGATRDREDGAPHSESDETGRGHAARADVVAARGLWDGGRKEHQPQLKPPQHARPRGLRPHSKPDRAGRGNAAHGPRG